MFAPFGEILRLFVPFLWSIVAAEGPSKAPFGITEKEGSSKDPFG